MNKHLKNLRKTYCKKYHLRIRIWNFEERRINYSTTKTYSDRLILIVIITSEKTSFFKKTCINNNEKIKSIKVNLIKERFSRIIYYKREISK